jgi:hypothetical protein
LNSSPRISRSRPALVAVAALAVIAAVAAACGGSSSASTPKPTQTSGNSAAAGTPGRGFGNRTPRPEIQTAIAEGTTVPFGNRARNPAVETAIAEGTTLPFGNRTPSPEIQTAIAEGTPASALFGGRGGFGGAQALTAAATVLGIDETQLRSELQAPGATLAGVAAAHGQDRATFRQALIDAVKKSFDAAVASGSMTQDQATQTETSFESGLDRLLDNPGATSAPPAPDSTP